MREHDMMMNMINDEHDMMMSMIWEHDMGA